MSLLSTESPSKEMLRRLFQWMRSPASSEPSKTPLSKPKRIALAVGHSRIGDKGAVDTRGRTEWAYNDHLALWLGGELEAVGHQVKIFNDYPRRTYGEAMRWLHGELDIFKPDYAVELHFNSAGPTAHGFEYIYHHPMSEPLARAFAAAHAKHVPWARPRADRGVMKRPEWDGSSAGLGFLRYTGCPTVITEPFFGSNRDEVERYGSEVNLPEVYFDALTNVDILLSLGCAAWRADLRDDIDT